MQQIALFSLDWRTWGHVANLCPAPKSVNNRRACNGHVGFDEPLGFYVCKVCGQMSTHTEIRGETPWRGEL